MSFIRKIRRKNGKSNALENNFYRKHAKAENRILLDSLGESPEHFGYLYCKGEWHCKNFIGHVSK